MNKPIYTEFGEICDEIGIQPTSVSDTVSNNVTPVEQEPDDATSQQRYDELNKVNERIATLEMMFDKHTSGENSAVEHPSHYTSGGIECIDAMKAMLAGYEQATIVTKFYWHFLSGQVLKYLWRWPLKERPLQDLKKARWYLDQLIEDIAKQDNQYSRKEVSE